MSTIVQPWQGGTGVSSVGAYGNPELSNGVWSFAKAARSVKYYGATGDGSTDDSAAIQAAIDSDYPAIYFEPDGIYKLSSPVVIDSITDANSTAKARLIHGMGCRISADSVANCFQFTDDVWPNNHRHTQFHDFIFTGTCSDAFIKWTSNYSWYNQIYNIRVDDGGSALALLKLTNTLAASNPGMFKLRNLMSRACKHTILLTKGGTGLGVFDDFRIYEITGGDYQEHAAAVTVDTGCNLTYSHIHDIGSGGPHAINAAGADISKSRIERIYLEVPATNPPTYPTSFDNNWGVAGTITDSSISDIWGYITSRAATPTGHPAMRMVYGIVNRCSILNVGIHCVSDSGAPYAVTYYPAIEVTGGSDVTHNFPQQYYSNGINLSGLYHNNLSAPGMIVKNTTDSLQEAWCRDTQISNYGQGGAAVLTLPHPKAGMRMRFTMTATGKSYAVKAGVGDKIILNGTALDDGDKVINSNTAIGDAILFYAFNSGYTSGTDYDYDWIAVTEGGTWTDGGA